MSEVNYLQQAKGKSLYIVQEGFLMARKISSPPLRSHSVKLFIPGLVMVQFSPFVKRKYCVSSSSRLADLEFPELYVAV